MRGVAFGAASTSGMQEHERVVGQVLEREADDVLRAGQSGVRMSNPPFGLKAARPQPLVCKGKPLTTVIVLGVVDPNRAPSLEHGAVPRHAVWNVRQELRQVQGGVGVVADAEE